MDTHTVEYDRLFDYGALESRAIELISQLPNVDPEQLSLSFLARHNSTRKRLPYTQSSLIHRGVKRILYATYDGAFGDAHAFLHDLQEAELRNMMPIVN